MAPVLPTFHVSELPEKVNELPHGKTRSPPLNLSSLPLKELVQYRCNVRSKDGGPPVKGTTSVIVCEPVVRFYRQCKDGLMIETTAWEDWRRGNGAESRGGPVV